MSTQAIAWYIVAACVAVGAAPTGTSRAAAAASTANTADMVAAGFVAPPPLRLSQALLTSLPGLLLA